MAQILAIAYNTGTNIPGTLQYGVLAVSNSNRDYSNNYGGVTWWATPDLDQRYVICYPQPDGTHPTPIEGVTSYLGFWGSETKTEQDFLYLANNIPATDGLPNFSTAIEANDWLFDNGYWTSYPESSSNRTAPNPLELCYIYAPCDRGESFILIKEENAENYPVGKWFDGNCYYKTNTTTYSNQFTFLSGQSYENCDNCLVDCLLESSLSTVNCKLFTTVESVTVVEPTPTPTPTPTSLCFNPTVSLVDCGLDVDIVGSLYNVRLRACCKDYINQTNYIISKNLVFVGITPSLGGVIIYNSICYEILLLSEVIDSSSVTVDNNIITTLFTGVNPCKTCTTYYQPCKQIIVSPTPESTPTPTPTPNYSDRVDLTLRNCCDGRLITVSADITVFLIPGQSIISLLSKSGSDCYTVVSIDSYSGGILTFVNETNHYNNDGDCWECLAEHPCDVNPTPSSTPTPTPTSSQPLVPNIHTARVCCGEGYNGLTTINIVLSENTVLEPGFGFIYEGFCYEIIDTYIESTLITDIDESDLKGNICYYPGCCPSSTPNPTATSTQTPTPTPTPTRNIPQVDCSPLDIVFVIDNTYSMGVAIEEIKNSILDITNFVINESNGNYRFGLVIFDEDSSDYSSNIIDTLPSDQIYYSGLIKIFCLTTMEYGNVLDFTDKINSLNGNGIPLGWGGLDPEPSDIALSLVINDSFAGSFEPNNGKMIVLFTDNLPSGYNDSYTEEDYTNVSNLSSPLINDDIRPIIMMKNIDSNFNNESILNDNINPYINLSEQCNGIFVNSHEPQEVINAINNLCIEILPSSTPNPTSTNTPTPSSTPSPTFGNCSNLNLNLLPTTVNGVTITKTYTGDISSASGGSYCGIYFPNNSLAVGTNNYANNSNPSPFTLTINFSSYVNYVRFSIGGAGVENQTWQENFIFTTNTGGSPELVPNPSHFCNGEINGNEVVFPVVSSPYAGSGEIMVINNTPFNSITISGNGGANGSVIAMCSNFNIT